MMMIRANGEYRERPLHHYYEAPPPPPPPPSRFSSSGSGKACYCCLFLLLSFIALLVLAALLVIVLAIKPKKPELNLQQVGFQYMAITTDSNGPITTTLSLTLSLLFTVVNPNRVGIRCGKSRFTVMYRGVTLGRASVPRFCQEPHSVRKVVVAVAVDGVKLPEVDAVDLTRDALLNDRLELRVLGDVGAKIRLLNLDSPRLQVSVDCVIVISPRKQSLTYKQCGFNGSNV